MKIYTNGQIIEEQSPAIALGNFDGMHKGHIEVIKAAKDSGSAYGALLFRSHSSNMLGNSVKIITPLNKKIEILDELGADFVYLVDFNEAFMNMTEAEFSSFLNSIGVKTVSVGYDYRCCKGGKTDAAALAGELEKYDIETVVAEPITENGMPIKSTLIREMLISGEVKKANALMYRRYSMCGKVVKGLQNGHLLGFPTANIEVPSEEVILKDGVYFAITNLNGKAYPSMVNIGKNPTFDAERRTVEVHIIDFDCDLYGDEIEVEFYDYIRQDKKFSSMEELTAQLKKDREEVLKRYKNEVKE